ncbi:hypothetical protein KFE25_002783 [Diacronema lutheri]|uniref:Pyrroline-5-carboxylate reductase catalytic N-terminal domain-containing protein n=1 Tax=Diacronema lutheri TaxID=2081491 RepID=A0A8J5XBB9_DIALT|nr:hypothetical protein KFE25_002783 [Diacronema lutheri]
MADAADEAARTRLKLAADDATLGAKPIDRNVHASILPQYLTFQAAKAVIATHCMFVVYTFRCAQELATARTIDLHPQSWRPRLARYRAASAPRTHMFIKPRADAAPAMRIGLIGCGVVGRTIVESLLDSGLTQPSDLAISTRTTTRVSDLSRQGVITLFDNVAVASDSNILFVCVLSPQLNALAAELRDALRPCTLIVVVAAALPTAKMRALFPHNHVVHASSVNVPRLRAELSVDRAVRARDRARALVMASLTAEHAPPAAADAPAGTDVEIGAEDAADAEDAAGAEPAAPAASSAPPVRMLKSTRTLTDDASSRVPAAEPPAEGARKAGDGDAAAPADDDVGFVAPAAIHPSYLIRGPEHIVNLAASHASELWVGALTAALDVALLGAEFDPDERKLVCLKAALGPELHGDRVLQSIDVLDSQRAVVPGNLPPAQMQAARLEHEDAARTAASQALTASVRANLQLAISQLHANFGGSAPAVVGGAQAAPPAESRAGDALTGGNA